LKNLQQGDYKLDVKSLTGDEFERSTDLDLNTKKYSVFVQTDKSIYKPSDKVQFRVLILDSNTRPYSASRVQIFINDGDKNRIRQFDDVKFLKGVYQDEFQLSDLPVMGTWTIQVRVDGGEEMTKTFEVAEYVLPKYEVIVESDPHVTFKDEKIRATVRAKYTYGKPVKGQVTLSAYPVLWLGGVQPFVQDSIVRKVIQVEAGKGSAEFDIRKELKIEGDYERYINIEAIFEEELTGRRQNGSTQITIHKFKYNMELIKESENYKPGLPFNLFIKVNYHDGMPLQDKTNPIQVYVSYTWNDENDFSTDYYMDEHGMARVKIFVPTNTSHLSIKVNFNFIENFINFN
jgi:CD109 antigen